MINYLKAFTLSVVLAGSIVAAKAQTDPVLFTVGKTPVTVSEFRYIYTKTNQQKASFTEASLREYLDLYTKFKLKVNRAHDMRLDTVPSLRDELEGYRKQLANSYLIDRTIVDQLVHEAYDRSKEDINISHILAQMPANPSPADTLTAYRKAFAAMNRLKAGEPFEKVAKDGSEDSGTKDNGGKVGWFTALQLPGFYGLESAAYNTPKGSISGIVRSPLGYHVLKINDRRKAVGEVKASHILVRIKKDFTQGEKDTAKLRINQLYTRLSQEKFEDVAEKYSEDKITASKGGDVGRFGINKFETAFEDAAFSLSKNGDYSKPFESSLGWHIIKRVERFDIPSYDEIKAEYTGRVKRDSRFERAQETFVAKVKAENNYTENAVNKDAFMNGLTKEFLTYQWKTELSASEKEKQLFSIGDKKHNLGEFVTFLERSASARGRRGETAKISTVFDELFAKFVQQKCLEFEEGLLDKKYPEFRSLMREYEEGILLFEATKRMVWDKASEDSTGLKAFYAENKGKYMWGQRVRTIKYNINSEDPKIIEKVHTLAAKSDPKRVLEKINGNMKPVKNKDGKTEAPPMLVTYEEALVEKGKNPAIDAMKWEKGVRGADSKAGTTTSFTQVQEVVAPMPKTLKEARGYVVAEYQDFLEKKWLEDLKNAYPIKIDESNFKSLIGSK